MTMDDISNPSGSPMRDTRRANVVGLEFWPADVDDTVPTGQSRSWNGPIEPSSFTSPACPVSPVSATSGAAGHGVHSVDMTKGSLPLTLEEVKSYTSIIDRILATSDLYTVTRRQIRVQLEKALGGITLINKSNAIKALIEERFDNITGSEAAVSRTLDSCSSSSALREEVNDQLGYIRQP
ncbi:hypothetical protein CH063_03700, partial [Colletotrichum higginsianum]